MNLDEAIEIVFPKDEGLLDTSDTLIDRLEQTALNQFKDILGIRYHCAVSGAMRWPWSQEAVLRVTNRANI
jgi:hypothetical protein